MKVFSSLLGHRWSVALLLCLLLVFAGLFSYHKWPQNEASVKRSMAVVVRCSRSTLQADGKTVLNFDADTTYIKAVWVNHLNVVPSCFGQLMSLNDAPLHPLSMSPAEASVWVERRIDSLEQHMKDLKVMDSELRYYLRVHAVQDEGYALVQAYATRMRQHMDSVYCEQNLLKKLKHTRSWRIGRITTYYVCHIDEAQHRVETPCHVTGKSKDGRYLYYQTNNSRTPSGCDVLRKPSRLRLISDTAWVERFGAIGQRSILRLHSFYNLPRPKGHKHDNGVWRKVCGRLVSGTWRADTLVSGTRIDSLGCYMGELNRKAEAHGHGQYFYKTGEYYNGFWKHDKRQGYGFAIAPHRYLRAGEWKNDVYKGERVNYTPNRIYGIDVSRYQHDIGKRHYAIDWKHVRIAHLGHLSRKRISGRVDYPITFAYIKSTEGITLYNRYHVSDCRQARAHGIHVGAYHFFSTRSNAARQAYFFLRKSSLHRGDLPPVLDLEPSPAQIRQMGGISAMWKGVRTWLSIVGRHTGSRPILYVSQMFVNRYLDHAPDIKRQYQVWIARYGEYKPDVRLAIWQLAPDGHVAGIHGKVDISVFNGYQSEFKEFLERGI